MAPAGTMSRTVADLDRLARAAGPDAYAAALAEPRRALRVAVNQELCGLDDTALSPDDEVALFPPMTGG